MGEELRARLLEERKLWPQYVKAYEAAIGRTSAKWAPWYIVPSNRKWVRNLVVGTTIVQTLKRLKMRLPEVDFDPGKIVIE